MKKAFGYVGGDISSPICDQAEFKDMMTGWTCKMFGGNCPYYIPGREFCTTYFDLLIKETDCPHAQWDYETNDRYWCEVLGNDCPFSVPAPCKCEDVFPEEVAEFARYLVQIEEE